MALQCRPPSGTWPGSGVMARQPRGGFGGTPPPNVDGGHHFGRKCDFATKNAIFSAAALGLRAAAFLGNYVYIYFCGHRYPFFCKIRRDHGLFCLWTVQFSFWILFRVWGGEGSVAHSREETHHNAKTPPNLEECCNFDIF